MTPTAAELVRLLDLAPHPEGGFYRESYRSAGGHAGRSHSTAIYFLLPRGAVSRLHRIASDEVWHLYLGGPLDVVELQPDGTASTTRLGRDLAAGEHLQHVVPAGVWFGARPAPQTDYALVGCTVAPGFDFADFELGTRADLLAAFPHARETILALTP